MYGRWWLDIAIRVTVVIVVAAAACTVAAAEHRGARAARETPLDGRTVAVVDQHPLPLLSASEAPSSFYSNHTTAFWVIVGLVALQVAVLVALVLVARWRWRAERALVGLLKAAPIGLGIAANRVLVRVNEGLCQMLGYSESELVGQSVRMLYPTEAEYQRVGELGYRQLGKLGMSSLDTQWVTRDGRLLDIVLRLALVDREDAPSGITFAAMDVTHRREAESEIRERERMLRTLLSNLPGMAYRCLNDRNWTMTFVSAGCQALTGYGPDDLLENQKVSFAALIHAEDREAVWHAVQDALDEGRSYEIAYRIHRAGGAERWVHDRGVAVVPSDGGPAVLEGFISDITDRKHTEEERERLQGQLWHTQKMEAIGQLASGVAHDFNNLLTVISSHAEMVRNQVSAESKVFESMKMMERAVEQATSVTRSLLTFSQRVRTNRRPMNLYQAVDEAAKMLWRTLPATVQVVIDTECDVSPWINADATQVHQIIVNLAINARDAMPKGGTLTISVHGLDSARLPEGGHDVEKRAAQLIITDTGTGMSPEVRSRIFEPFFSTKGPGGGTGLGLAVVHGIVAEHGGTIDVESEEGQGTRVTVTFPRIDPPAVEARGTAEAVPCGQGETILVADDYPYVRSIIATTLVSAGYHVLQAEDGEVCMALFRERGAEIDLFLLDVDLPHKTGFECLREMREAGSQAPAILITGRADEQNEPPLDERAMVFPKPFTMAELSRGIHDWLQKHKGVPR